MNKLDQKIQEINTEILVLAGKKSKLLAIKFDAKGGAGSGLTAPDTTPNSGNGGVGGGSNTVGIDCAIVAGSYCNTPTSIAIVCMPVSLHWLWV